MELIILGSGGVEGTPKPCCSCERCKEAREKMGKYFRSGPSLFIKPANILIDTPEEIRSQLIKNKIDNVKAIFYTHWHPDHIMGIRVVEQIRMDYGKYACKDCNVKIEASNERNSPIDVYISKEQLDLLDKFIIRKELFDFYEKRGLIKLHLLKEKEVVKFDNIEIEGIFFPDSTAFYYLIRENNKKVIYMPCEIRKIEEREELKNADYLIIHFSWWEKEKICHNAPWTKDEVSVERILEFSKNLSIKNIIFTHIDECHQKTYKELKELEKKYKKEKIKFAYDGMRIKL